MGRRKGSFNKNSKTKKLRYFIEDNQPTLREIAEFLYGNCTPKSLVSARSKIPHVKPHFKKEGLIMGAIKINDEWRYKVLDRCEEIEHHVRRNSRSCIGNYRNLLFKEQVAQIQFPGDKSLKEIKKLSLTTQKSIIDQELLLLNEADNDDTRN